jgi:hypothetical protein
VNIIRNTLVSLQAQFLVGCVTILFYLVGFGLLFSVGWKVGLGALLVWWASMVHSKVGQ